MQQLSSSAAALGVVATMCILVAAMIIPPSASALLQMQMLHTQGSHTPDMNELPHSRCRASCSLISTRWWAEYSRFMQSI